MVREARRRRCPLAEVRRDAQLGLVPPLGLLHVELQLLRRVPPHERKGACMLPPLLASLLEAVGARERQHSTNEDSRLRRPRLRDRHTGTERGQNGSRRAPCLFTAQSASYDRSGLAVQGEKRREHVPSGTADVWAEIQSDWPKRDFRKLHELVERLPVSVVELDRLFDEEAPSGSAAKDALRKAFDSAGSPENRVLVALYVYARCLDAWERSTDYPRIRIVLDEFGPAAAELVDGDGAGSAGESALLKIVVAQTVALDDSMAVESGLNCSCPMETGTRAGRVARTMEHLLEELGQLRVDSDVRAVLVRADAEAQRGYFDAVSKTAEAVLRLVDPNGAMEASVDEAPDGGEAGLGGDVYGSELRAHRATLTALRDAAPLPRLHVDQAKLVYVYPFTLERFDPRSLAG